MMPLAVFSCSTEDDRDSLDDFDDLDNMMEMR
jgi:hypothetical protein